MSRSLGCGSEVQRFARGEEGEISVPLGKLDVLDTTDRLCMEVVLRKGLLGPLAVSTLVFAVRRRAPPQMLEENRWPRTPNLCTTELQPDP